MEAYQVDCCDGIDALKTIDVVIPEPAAGQVLVKMKACSLNYRDILITQGGYVRNDTRPVVPLSDGAGEVVAVGADVTAFKPGDRVIGNFFQHWNSGAIDDAGLNSALGGAIDGVLAEYFILEANNTVRIPDYLSYEAAATLPCAATTAWHALFTVGQLKKGDTVLLLGTGGVSVFGLQLAKAIGATVIITSSSEQKLKQVKDLGADHTLNYVETPDWERAVLGITKGKGVDIVLEVGGAGTFEKSVASTAVNGTVALIGILSGLTSPSLSLMTIFNLLRIQGIYVGSTEMLKSLLSFMEGHEIQPVVDRVYEFCDAKDAYRYMQSAQHLGKVVIKGV